MRPLQNSASNAEKHWIEKSAGSALVLGLIAIKIQEATWGYTKSETVCEVNLVKINTIIRFLDVAV